MASWGVSNGYQLMSTLQYSYVQQVCNSLLMLQAQLSCSNLNTALPYVMLLSGVCREQPELLASYMPQLKECLGSFAGLSADAAQASKQRQLHMCQHNLGRLLGICQLSTATCSLFPQVLLLALWPLCRVRSDLQDHVIMLLRKMMYRQDAAGRQVMYHCMLYAQIRQS